MLDLPTLDLGSVINPRSSTGQVVDLSRIAVVGASGLCGHERANDGKEEWLTPSPIVQALGSFDLDPCSPIQRPWPTAKKHYTILDDGLKQPWAGRVWLNPPYGNKTEVWMKRLAEHGNGIAFIFARTETATWFDSVWPHASAFLFLKGRVSFCHVDGRQSQTSAGAPSVLIAYGEDNARCLKQCGLPGKFLLNN